MTAINQSFSMLSGNSKLLRFSIEKEGVPVNLSNYYIKWGLRENEFLTKNLILKTSDSGITTESSDTIIRLTPDDTKHLIGMYFHECKIIDKSTNDEVTVATGTITINKSSI